MSLLTDLQDLNLRDNDITGTVPSSWAELTSLRESFATLSGIQLCNFFSQL